MLNILEKIKKVKESSFIVANISSEEREKALRYIAKGIMDNIAQILTANEMDIKTAESNGMQKFLIDRLKLTSERIKKMSKAVIEVASLPDPIGEITDMVVRPNGMRVGMMRVPLGVVGTIYEARPNVTSDIVALALKSGNGVVLRGGKEAFNSNLAIANIINKALKGSSIPSEAVYFVENTDRKYVKEMLKLKDYIDVIIPRGGESLINFVSENSLIPVVKHDKGVCSIFIDKTADYKMSCEIVKNAKLQRPSVCNAIENLWIHRDWNKTKELLIDISTAGAILLGDERVSSMGYKKGTEEDFYTEFLDNRLSVGIVDNFTDAVRNIDKYGSSHSDGIITNDYYRALRFLKEVDSASVYVNASTRFTDGGEFGLGAEVGISTQKLHVRGPMGIRGLTCKKYIIFGTGQIRT